MNEAGESRIARPGEEPEIITDPAQFGPLDENGIPRSWRGTSGWLACRLSPSLTNWRPSNLGKVRTLCGLGIWTARPLQCNAMYMTLKQTRWWTQSTGTVYVPVQGTWTAADGSTLPGGFWVGSGWRTSHASLAVQRLRCPLLNVTIWNFIFPFLTVLTTFFLGLFTAMLFNDLPGRKIIRSLLIIPYTIPSLVTILIWRGMFMEPVGVIYTTLVDIFGSSPSWFQSPFWAKVGILTVNLWLGYPYFMLGLQWCVAGYSR